ncbi:hypothetical protein ABGB07_36185 [Micromonosporaceae bacterium B7E4]
MTGQNATPRHPNTLHALSAAWSLRQARQRLDIAVEVEARAVAAESRALAVADGIRSSQWSTGRSRGGHGDPTGTAALTRVGPPEQAWPLAQLAAGTTSTLTWLADTLRLTAGPDPMWRILDSLPRLHPGTAATVTSWLAEADEKIRTTLRLGPDERLLPGAECPACGRRPMTAHTAAPGPTDWTAVCAAGCRCAGQGCGCGMLVQVEGAVHIWPDAAGLVAAMELAQWPRRWLVGLPADGGEAA